MTGILLALFLVLALTNLLGPYSIRIRAAGCVDAVRAQAVLVSAGSCFGVEWKSDGPVRLVVLGLRWKLGRAAGDRPRKDGRTDSASSGPDERGGQVRGSGFSVRNALRLLRAAGGAVQLDRMHACIRLGTGNPAVTGMLFGLAQALGSGWGGRISIRMDPDFTGRMMAGTVEADARFVLIRLLARLVKARSETG
jgi:hypothetical protein